MPYVPVMPVDDALPPVLELAVLDRQLREAEETRDAFEAWEQAWADGTFDGTFDSTFDAAGEGAEPTGAAAPVGVLTLADASARLLAELESLEAERARLDARIVDAYGALHTVLDAQVQEHTSRPGVGSPVPVSTDEVFLMEVTTATAVPAGEAARRLRLAHGRRTHRGLRERLTAGTVSLLHATMIAEACAELATSNGADGTGAGVPSEEQVTALVEQVTTRVLAPMPDGSRPTHTQIRSRLHRVITSLRSPEADTTRRQRARDRRGVYARLTEDGMGELTWRAPGEQVVAVMDRLEHLARAMRHAGDPRSLDQLRADLTATALLTHPYGPCPQHTPDHTLTHPTDQPTDATDPAAKTADAEAAEAEAAEDEVEQDGPCGCAPTAPAATVWIIVPFEVATGTSTAACEIPGHGWVTASHARTLITAPGSQWRWLGVDHTTGHALHLSTTGYRPTPAMTDQIRALDGHCRGPGCETPAHHCDLDHHTPYPAGPTSVPNLGPLHRRHHNLKTSTLWTTRRTTNNPTSTDPTSTDPTSRALHWTTLTGRDYITYPKSWTQALHDQHDPPEPNPRRIPHGPPPF